MIEDQMHKAAAMLADWPPPGYPDEPPLDEVYPVLSAPTPVIQPPMLQTVAEFLAEEEAPYDWLVPGLFERGDRLIVTGPEGGGKSTFLRQLAVQLAAGIHPFGGEPFAPVRVMLLDVENSERQVRRAMRPLYLTADREDLPLYMGVTSRGLDLLQQDDAQRLLAVVDSVRPDLIIGGPLYKLASGDPTEEMTARVITGHLDRLRSQFGLGLILEAHSPHASGPGKRPMRPYGASLWLRWPECGLYLSKEGELTHWRGPRDEREWPVMLQRGGTWPWTKVTRERDVLWVRIKGLCTDAGEQLAQRDLAQLLGVSQPTVNRTIKEHTDEWSKLAAKEDE